MPWPKSDSAHRVSGGRNRPYPRPETWKRVVQPLKNPHPPRPRPTIFFYVFTLLYSQSGFTRKFRHFLPCQHNVTYFAIPDQQKRHLYALGSDCLICAFCEETIVAHSHLSIFQCPCDNNCPKSSKLPPTVIDAKIQHFCQQHQSQVPHPFDLNAIPNLPVPMGAPSQFTFHSSFPMDSMLVAQALQEKTTEMTFPGPSNINPFEASTLDVNNPPVNLMRPPMRPPPARHASPCTCSSSIRRAGVNRVPTPIPPIQTKGPKTPPKTPPPSPIQQEEIEVEVELVVDEDVELEPQDGTD